MPIHLLGSDCFLGPLPGRPKAGVAAHSFIGLVKPTDKSQFKAYLKVYPMEMDGILQNSPKRSLENEAIGHTIAKCCELKVPEEAGFIRLYPAQIPDKPNWLNEPVIAWFAKEIEGLTMESWLAHSRRPGDIYKFQLSRALRDNIDQYAAIAAFDAALYNTDRNPGNFFNNGTLIDHGNILSGDDWTEESLLELKNQINDSNLIIQYLQEHAHSLQFKNSRLQQGKMQLDRFNANKALALKLMHDILYDGSESTSSTVLDFIEHRLNTSNSANAIGLLV